MKSALVLLSIVLAFFLSTEPVRAGVFFNDDTGSTDDNESAPPAKTTRSSTRKPASSERATVKLPTKTATSGMDMRKIRRAAVGAQAAGALGMGGVLLELNFTPNWAFNGGFGGGEGFQAYMLQVKYVLTGDWLMPYATFGYANWASVGKSGPIQKTKPAILAERLLNDDEKADGQFKKHILYPGFGLQFMQLDGDYAGFSMYAEMVMLLDVGNFVAAPTGALGVMYFF